MGSDGFNHARFHSSLILGIDIELDLIDWISKCPIPMNIYLHEIHRVGNGVALDTNVSIRIPGVARCVLGF